MAAINNKDEATLYVLKGILEVLATGNTGENSQLAELQNILTAITAQTTAEVAATNAVTTAVNTQGSATQTAVNTQGGNVVTAVNNQTAKVMGEYGFERIISGTPTTTGRTYMAFTVITDAVVTAVSTQGSSISGDLVAAGTTIYGIFSSISVTSGSLYAYRRTA